MPTYDYECPKCGGRQEVILSISDHQETLPCECGGIAERVFLTAPVVLVKGNQPDFKLDWTDMPIGWEHGNTDCVAQERRYAKIINETKKLAIENDREAIKGGIRHIARIPKELDRARSKQFGNDYFEPSMQSKDDLKAKLKADGMLFKN